MSKVFFRRHHFVASLMAGLLFVSCADLAHIHHYALISENEMGRVLARPRAALRPDHSGQPGKPRRAAARAFLTCRSYKPSFARPRKRKGNGKRSCSKVHNDCSRHVDRASSDKEPCPAESSPTPNAASRCKNVWRKETPSLYGIRCKSFCDRYRFR